jgi:hypothetical protein
MLGTLQQSSTLYAGTNAGGFATLLGTKVLVEGGLKNGRVGGRVEEWKFARSGGGRRGLTWLFLWSSFIPKRTLHITYVVG